MPGIALNVIHAPRTIILPSTITICLWLLAAWDKMLVHLQQAALLRLESCQQAAQQLVAVLLAPTLQCRCTTHLHKPDHQLRAPSTGHAALAIRA